MKEMTNKELNKYVREITERKFNPVLCINSLMEVATYNDLKAFELKLPIVHRGLLKLPYLRRKDYSNVLTTGYLINRESPIDYIDLLVYIFEKNADILTKYASYRDQYEIYVLRGEYQEAKTLLDKINKEISFSLWSAINTIKTTRLSEGLNACNAQLSQLSKQIKDFNFILFWNYKTSSIDISFASSVDQAYNEFKSLDENALNYLVAHCFPYKGYADEGRWVYRDFNSSIIDLYISFIHLLVRYSPSISKESKVAAHLDNLISVLHDPILEKCVWIITKKWKFENQFTGRKEIIKAFLECRDDDVISQSLPYLKIKPSDFKILDLLVKSLIRSGGKLPSEISEDILFGKVATYYFKYMKYGGNHLLNYSRLSNIYNALHSFVCFRQLGEMVESRHHHKIQDIYKDSWRYTAQSDLEDAVFYAEDERAEYVNSYLNSVGMTEKEFSPMHGGDSLNLQLYGRNFSEEEWEMAINGLHNNSFPTYTKGLLAAYVIEELLKQDKLAEAISIYVEQKMIDQFIRIQIDIKDIKNRLEEEDVERSLDIPLVMSIFHTITNSISSKRKLAYRRYLKQRGVSKASELPVDTSDKYLMYFLTEVIDTDVLQLDGLRFKNSIQALDERIKIFQNLYTATRNKEYYNELALLDNEKTIKGLTKTLDQSKIFVDTDALLEREVSELRDLYVLYAHTGDTVKTLEANDRLYMLKETVASILAESKGEHKVVFFDTHKNYQEVFYKDSLFKQFYLAVRNKFLLDPKYGLDYHLSTRIRHGFLSNQIRTNFLDKNLVTNIGIDNKYTPDTYWSVSTFQLSDEKKQQCQKLLLDFTTYLDSVISIIKDNLIQVRTEDYNEDLDSCFDYRDCLLNETIHLTQKSVATSNYDVAVNLIFDSLWSLTEFNLQLMKDQLDHYSLLVQARMDTLEHDILQLIPSNKKGSQQFKATIANAKTQFQNDMQAISRWFNRRNELASEFNLELSLQTCIDTINRINQYKIEADPEIHAENVYNGKYLSRFNDLFHNLLNNVLDYNKGKNRNGKCRIFILEENDWLTINVSNDIDPEDTQKVLEDTTINKQEIDSKLSSGKSRGEGHSGIVKIYNIVHNVFRHPDNSYGYLLDNGCLTAEIKINISNLIQKDEDTDSRRPDGQGS